MSTVTEQLRPLRAELERAREQHGDRSTPAREAFENLFRTAAKLGHPLDQLSRRSPDEVERFFASTLPGTDGHVYWDGGKQFTRNDGKGRVPRRWWYAHKHGAELPPYQDLVPTCGEDACINPDHCEIGRGLRRPRRYTDERIIGAIQVAAMRLGRTPSSEDWDGHFLPDRRIIRKRFGTWNAAMRAAGLEPRRNGVNIGYAPASTVGAIAALRFCQKRLNRRPRRADLNLLSGELHAQGLPSSPTTVRKLLGPWDEALRKAGIAA